MKATDWEFRYRAVIFGMIFGATFPLYGLDPVNSATALSNAAASTLRLSPDVILRVLLAAAALIMIIAALIRTWASSYLNASVVYAGDVKSESLVADGPYRYVRNPLYFANVLMTISLGALMSRLGLGVAIVAMLVFCYRLIVREESALRADQGARYVAYLNAVPSLWPAARARIGTSGKKADWSAGFKAEAWYWGFAAAVTAFAITLNSNLFFVILGASILTFWIAGWYAGKKRA